MVQKLSAYEQRHPDIYQDKFKRVVTMVDAGEDEGPTGEREVAWLSGLEPQPRTCKWVKPPGPPRGFDFDVTKTEQIFDLLLAEKHIKLIALKRKYAGYIAPSGPILEVLIYATCLVSLSSLLLLRRLTSLQWPPSLIVFIFSDAVLVVGWPWGEPLPAARRELSSSSSSSSPRSPSSPEEVKSQGEVVIVASSTGSPTARKRRSLSPSVEDLSS
ncbi:hypothetical protein QYE76_001497 [Lolium multiflorum]|uniref:Uncharacterized protein n=1 Tax=Lolium multiflorum TaxID=4521 RepID=A0AAD8VXE7_LOLMU|nr:hypothetical protein QYE76_001497 [Lolium multiflorum]